MVGAPVGRVTRSERSEETTRLILAEGLGLVAEEGLDRSSAISLAKRCGLSTGPVYARYDTPEDVAVDLWQRTLDPALAELLHGLRAAVAGSAAATADLAAEMLRPAPTTAAICELVAVARRYPQLAEQIREDLGSRLRAHLAAQPAVPPAMVLGQVSFLLGSLTLAPIVAEENRADGSGSLGLIAEICADVPARSAPRVDPEPRVMPLPESATGDPLRDELAEAVTAVVARVGFEHATATRIARQAGRGFSTYYKRFSSKDELLVSIVASLVEQIVRISARGFAGLSREEFIAGSVANARGLCAEENRENRHLRVEVMVAARHHPEIAEVVDRVYATARGEIEQEFRRTTAAADRERAMDYWALVRANNIGMSVLASATSMLQGVDWTPASAGLFDVFSSLRREE